MTIPPPTGPPADVRPRRADARRNREKLLAAAQEAFGRDGAQASLDGIARTAGVGPGTLYRNFPHRLALVEAVYADQVTELCARADPPGTQLPPFEAVREWCRDLGGLAVAHTALTALLAAGADGDPGGDADAQADGDGHASGAAELRTVTTSLVTRAREAGELRPDATPVDVLRMVHGIALAVAHLAPEARTTQGRRLTDLSLTGLRAP